MSTASFFISPSDLWLLIGTGAAPQIIDCTQSRGRVAALYRQRAAQLTRESSVRPT
jgi:hypothetical protein